MSYSASPACCSAASPELKLYQAFIFSVPIFFTFIILLIFYLFYLRQRRPDWSSLRMRTSNPQPDIPSAATEKGLKKELREMLPILVFKESFLIRETQCSICLGDYRANDRLQQIPVCGHTFHMDCINHWLTNNTTCPLCRVSLLPASRTSLDPANPQEAQTSNIQAVQGEVPEIIGNEVPSREEGDREQFGSCGGSDGQRCYIVPSGVEQCDSNGEDSVVINVEDRQESRIH